MQQGDIHDDDVLFNWTIQDTMIMLSSDFPFRTTHNTHLDTFQLLLPTLSHLGSLKIDINASIGLFHFPLHSTMFNLISFSIFLRFSHFVL